jgi:sensor c-di-GMP phosphodiesterase-like protein
MFRTRRLFLIIMLCVVAALAPICGLLWYSFDRSRQEAESQMARVAAATLARARDILDSADHRLRMLAVIVNPDCDAATIEELMRGPYETTFLRQTTLIHRGRLVCSSWGRADPPLAMPPGYLEVPPPNKSLVIREHEAFLKGGESVILNHRLDDDTLLNIIILPSEFLLMGQELAAAPGYGMRLEDERGTLLAQTGRAIQMPSGPAGIYRLNASTIAVQGQPGTGLAVAIRADESWILREARHLAAILVPLGVVLAACLVGLVLLVGRRHLGLAHRLAHALRKREFAVHYLPSIDLKSGRCIGAEALMRWPDPDEGMVRPDLFIPVAEESGVILPMTDWLIEQVALEMGAAMRADPDFHVAINLCRAHLYDKALVARTLALVQRLGIPARSLHFELTERAFVGLDQDAPRAVIEQLQAQGCAIGLDDFGTGYSSLGYLSKLKVDFLKIDKSFVDAIGQESATSGLVGVIVDMARQLNLSVVAEGVETEAQAKRLAALGVQTAQGWFYGKACAAADFLGWRRARNEQIG